MMFRALLQLFLGVGVILGPTALARAEQTAGASGSKPANTGTIAAAASAPAGSKIEVNWTGPARDIDRIAILPPGAPEGASSIAPACFTFHPKVYCTVPNNPGPYELRLVIGGKTFARRKLAITAVTATLDAPATAVGGSEIIVRWTGPNNEFDTIGILKRGTPDNQGAPGLPNFTFNYKSRSIHVPEEPGEYELRYFGTGKVLARRRLTVTGATASLSAPPSVVAGSTLLVAWKGPGGEFDRLIVVPKGAPEGSKAITSNFVFNRSPAAVRAPLTTGGYEVCYQTAGSGAILARAPFSVTPAKEEPGFVRVTSAAGAGSGSALSGAGAVEVILDASGSMLQRIGSERRIDIAKQTLTKLTAETIPAGTPFALRVIGRGASSCESELYIPLAPLDRAAAASKLLTLEAKSNAKTPIGSALERIVSDLSGAQGEHVVILVTDGEETCGGHPTRAIQKLREAGTNVHINIVGFALDDKKLARTLEVWAAAGGGSYFDARDAKSLGQAFTQSVRPVFEINDAQKNLVGSGVVGGDSVRLMPGSYTVTLRGARSDARPVTVRARETSSVSF
ncbi:MAG TPA: VWA domain-containing protein [Polyangiaceae bacterium]|nr:VWA domain-containing protein [Polyangiaceae bacterium]